jgi:nucleotide-binding universal stress UspA family protein
MFPPRVILAAVDFSDASRAALAYAARLATQTRARLHVLHAEDPMLAEAARASRIDLTRETREELVAFVRSAAQSVDPAPVQHVVTGPAVDVVCDIAARENADVVVVGAHGMSGAARRMFGSTTEGILRNADRSILVVPDGWTPPQPHARDLSGTGPVIAAVDLTTPSLEAAGVGCQIAAALGTSVHAIHVVPALPVPARWAAQADAAVAARLATARREMERTLPCLRSGVPVTVRVETGTVAELLAAAAAAPGQHPLLVLGRRTRADRKGAPGATAYRVLTLAQVPLLVYLPESE